MTFMELAQNRFSERHFDSRPVEEEKLKQILEAGRVAPTACNLQPQRVYVIKSREAMEKAKSTRASLCGCPVALLVCYDSDTVWKNPRDRCYDCYNAGEQDANVRIRTDFPDGLYQPEGSDCGTITVRRGEAHLWMPGLSVAWIRAQGK